MSHFQRAPAFDDFFLKIFSGAGSFFDRIGSLFFFKAMRRALLLVFPIIMVGALALCLLNFPRVGVHGLLGPVLISLLQVVVDGTFGIAALAMLCSMSYCLGEMYNSADEKAYVHPFLYVVVAVGCFWVLNGRPGGSNFIELTSISSAMPEAVFVSSVSSLILSRLVNKRFRLSVVGTGYDLFSMEVFAIVPACMAVLGIFVVIRYLLLTAGFDSFQDMSGDLVSAVFSLVHGDLAVGALYVGLCQLFWFFGAHGPNVLHSVNADFIYPNLMENLSAVGGAAPGHILTQGFFNAFTTVGGSGFTLSLVTAILICGREVKSRQFSKLALLVCLFNINEPLLFGIPLILNPVYFLPFVFTPVILFLIAYAACALGFIPVVLESFHWTTPVFLSGFCAAGWSGVLLQSVLLTAGVLIYMPFVRLAERMQTMQFKESMKSLVRVARSCDVEKKARFVSLPGMEGFAARSLGSDLLEALRSNDQLYLVFQPQVNVADRDKVGAEALLRWNHPRYGAISPEIIIALAEDLGCIEEVSFFVLREACRHLEHWSGCLRCQPYVSVNFTPSLITDDLAEKIMAVTSEAGIAPHCLEMEITESDAVSTSKQTIDRLHGLRRRGFRIAIDDFGMGHTSLRYLREMPVDKVKIDRSLTLESSRGVNRHIVTSILELCRKIELRVIIEGVETEEQLVSFTEIGATSFQGYHFSRPLSAEECYCFIRKWTGEAPVCLLNAK